MKENIDSIYNDYFHDIYRFLLSLCHDHHTAEDLVQETFFRAHLYVENYDGENIKSWLFTVAHHAFIDHYRKQKRMEVKEKNFFMAYFDKRTEPEAAYVVQEEIDEIIHLIAGLSEKKRTAVLLHDFHEFSYKEASQVMNIPVTHYKVLLFRGRQAIRKAGENER